MDDKCPECGKGEFLVDEKAGAGTRRKYTCGHGKIVQVLNETIQFHETIIVTRFFHFKLLDRLFLGGIVGSTEDIKLEFDPSDKNYLIGFTIKGKFEDDVKSREFAVQQGTKLTNLLSAITGQFVYHNRPEVSVENNHKTQHTKSFATDAIVVRPSNVDLTNPEICSLLETDSKLNRQLDNFANGLKAFEDNQYGEAVRRFCLVFEGKYPPNLGNYEYLRDALSHLEVWDSTADALRIHFRIDCSEDKKTGKKALDTTSPAIRLELKKHAEILKREAIALLQSKISL